MIGNEVQKAIFSAINGAGICSGRIYDRVPEGVALPYVTIGDEQVTDDSTACSDGWEVYPTVHVWDIPVAGSKLGIKGIAASIVAAIRSINAIAGYSLVLIHHERTSFMRDPDGITEHAVISFRAVIDPE